MHPLVKKLAHQTAIYGVSRILVRFLNYALVPLQTRVFHPEQFGIVTEFYAYAAFFNVLFTYGMETTFFRFATQGHDKKDVYQTGLASLMLSSVLFSGVLIFFANPLSAALHYNGHPEYVILFAIIMGLDAMVVIPFSNLRQENRPMRFVGYEAINIGTNVGLNIFFLMLCPWILTQPSMAFLYGFIHFVYHPEWGVTYVFIANLMASTVNVLVMSQYFHLKHWHLNTKLWKQMLKYSWPLIIVGLAGMGNETLSRILLKYRYNGNAEEAMHALGIFGACYKMSILMTLFVQAYRMAAEPFFFNESKKQDPQLTYARTMNFFVIFCCFLFLLVGLYMNFFKWIFMGKEYYEGISVVPTLMIGNFFLGVYYNLTIWYKLTNKNVAGSLIAVGGVIITFLLNWYWIPVYGYNGSAWVTFITYGTMMTASYFLGQKYYPVPYNVRNFFVYVLLAVTLYLLNKYLQDALPENFLWLAYVSGTFFMALYLGVVYLIEKGKIAVLKPI